MSLLRKPLIICPKAHQDTIIVEHLAETRLLKEIFEVGLDVQDDTPEVVIITPTPSAYPDSGTALVVGLNDQEATAAIFSQHRGRNSIMYILTPTTQELSRLRGFARKTGYEGRMVSFHLFSSNLHYYDHSEAVSFVAAKIGIEAILQSIQVIFGHQLLGDEIQFTVKGRVIDTRNSLTPIAVEWSATGKETGHRNREIEWLLAIPTHGTFIEIAAASDRVLETRTLTQQVAQYHPAPLITRHYTATWPKSDAVSSAWLIDEEVSRVALRKQLSGAINDLWRNSAGGLFSAWITPPHESSIFHMRFKKDDLDKAKKAILAYTSQEQLFWKQTVYGAIAVQCSSTQFLAITHILEQIGIAVDIKIRGGSFCVKFRRQLLGPDQIFSPGTLLVTISNVTPAVDVEVMLLPDRILTFSQLQVAIANPSTLALIHCGYPEIGLVKGDRGPVLAITGHIPLGRFRDEIIGTKIAVNIEGQPASLQISYLSYKVNTDLKKAPPVIARETSLEHWEHSIGRSSAPVITRLISHAPCDPQDRAAAYRIMRLTEPPESRRNVLQQHIHGFQLVEQEELLKVIAIQEGLEHLAQPLSPTTKTRLVGPRNTTFRAIVDEGFRHLRIKITGRCLIEIPNLKSTAPNSRLGAFMFTSHNTAIVEATGGFAAVIRIILPPGTSCDLLLLQGTQTRVPQPDSRGGLYLPDPEIETPYVASQSAPSPSPPRSFKIKPNTAQHRPETRQIGKNDGEGRAGPTGHGYCTQENKRGASDTEATAGATEPPVATAPLLGHTPVPPIASGEGWQIDNHSNTCYVAAAFRILSLLRWPNNIQYCAPDHYMLRHVASGKAFTTPDVSGIRTMIVLRHATLLAGNDGGQRLAQDDVLGPIDSIFTPLKRNQLHVQSTCFTSSIRIECSTCGYKASSTEAISPYHIIHPRCLTGTVDVAGQHADAPRVEDIRLAVQMLFIPFTEVDPVGICPQCCPASAEVKRHTYTHSTGLAHSSDRGLIHISRKLIVGDPEAHLLLGAVIPLSTCHPLGYTFATVIGLVIYVAGDASGKRGHYYIRELRCQNKEHGIYDGFTGLQTIQATTPLTANELATSIVLQFGHKKGNKTPESHVGPSPALLTPASKDLLKAKERWDLPLSSAPIDVDEEDENMTVPPNTAGTVVNPAGRNLRRQPRRLIKLRHTLPGKRRVVQPHIPKPVLGARWALLSRTQKIWHRLFRTAIDWKRKHGIITPKRPRTLANPHKRTEPPADRPPGATSPGSARSPHVGLQPSSAITPPHQLLHPSRTSPPPPHGTPSLAPRRLFSSPKTGRQIQADDHVGPVTRSRSIKTAAFPPPLEEQEYGIISLFDGTSTTYPTIVKEIGYLPKFFIAAEWEPNIRIIVADKHGLTLDPKDPLWRKNKDRIPCRYFKDVWELLQDHGQVIKEFTSLFPDCKRLVVVAGSPCQDLSYMSQWKGLLGILGPRSTHFQIIPVLLIVLSILRPDIRLFLIIENAGSMRPYHKSAILDLIGMPGIAAKQIDAGTWGIVRRNRIFISNTTSFRLPPRLPSPWKPEWEVSRHAKHHVLMPWLRARGTTEAGNVILTAGAYHPFNLLYFVPFFGTGGDFAALWRTPNSLPNIDWGRFFPDRLKGAWQTILDWPIEQRYMPNKAEDTAAKSLADFFALHGDGLPFRPPDLQEKKVESELQDFYDDLGVSKPILTDELYTSLIGNFFKPSALQAATGTGTTANLAQFVRGQEAGLIFPQAVDPHFYVSRYKQLIEEVRAAGAAEHSAGSPHADPGLFAKFEKSIIQKPAAELPAPLEQWINEVVTKKRLLTRQPSIGTLKPVKRSDIPASYLPRTKPRDLPQGERQGLLIAAFRRHQPKQTLPYLTVDMLHQALLPIEHCSVQETSIDYGSQIEEIINRFRKLLGTHSHYLFYQIHTGLSVYSGGTEDSYRFLFHNDGSIYVSAALRHTDRTQAILAELTSQDHVATREIHQLPYPEVAGSIQDYLDCNKGTARLHIEVDSNTTIVYQPRPHILHVNFWQISVLGVLLGDSGYTLPYSAVYVRNLLRPIFLQNAPPKNPLEVGSLFRAFTTSLGCLKLPFRRAAISLTISFRDFASEECNRKSLAEILIACRSDAITVCLPAERQGLLNDIIVHHEIVIGIGWPTPSSTFSFGRDLPT